MATSSAFAAQFPESEFRFAIRESMKMGMPEDDFLKLKWHWNRVKTYVPADPAGRPLDWDQPTLSNEVGNPEDDPEDDGLIVDYAMETNNISSQVDQSITALGNINFQKIKITVFDVDFEKIKDADYATIGDVRYEIRLESPPEPLFGVTMHILHLEALDQA